ncbi:MAG: hypothetical protein ACM3SV_00505 [Betaproteobacteria bacterium]
MTPKRGSNAPADHERGRGDTKPEQQGEAKPRMPHEHDQSADQQSQAGRPGTDVTRQGYEDVKQGLVDTDRGPEMDKRRLNRVPADPKKPESTPR